MQVLQESRKLLQLRLEICGRRKATNFSAIQVPHNLAHKTQGRMLKTGRPRLNQHVARNDPEVVQARQVEVAELLQKGEADASQPWRAGMCLLHFDGILPEPRTRFIHRNHPYI
jgi:hypothetical protein